MGLLLCLILMAVCVGLAVSLGNPIFLAGFALVLIWLVIAAFAKIMCWMAGLTCGSSRRPKIPGVEVNSRFRVCSDPYCGRPNAPQARYCGQCGRRLA